MNAPKRGLLGSAGIVSAAIATSRITGLVRESVLSWMFGAGATYDAYVLGFRIPSLTRELFAEGALSSAFIPTFTRYLSTKTHEKARELSSMTAGMLMAIVGSFCALGMALSPLFVDLFAPGFHAVPGKWELAVSLVRTMFPFLLLVALAAQAQGILYTNHRFGVAAVSPAMFNVASVSGGLVLAYCFGIAPVRAMAIGVVIGGAIQLGFQLPSVWRAGFAWQPQWNMRRNLANEGVRHILSLMGPALIGSASGQINILVNTNFAAGFRDASGHVMNGPVSWLAYAYRFFALPMGVFGMAVASAALPRLSHSAAARNMAEFRETLSHSIATILLLTIPSSVGLAILGESMIAIVYQHGKFSAFDTRQTALALSGYAVGLAGYAILKLIAPAFYALGDARTPMVISIASVTVNGIIAFTFVRVLRFGPAGLALSASLVSIFSSVTLLLLLRGKTGGVNGAEITLCFAKVVAASAAMGVICYAVASGLHSHVATVLIGVPAGVCTFYAAARLLRLREVPRLSKEWYSLLARRQIYELGRDGKQQGTNHDSS